MRDPALTATVVQLPKPVAPSGIEHWAKFLLEMCGVDVTGTESVIAEIRLAQREAVEAEIAKVDEETKTLADRRQALLEQLRGGAIAHTHVDSGDDLHTGVR